MNPEMVQCCIICFVCSDKILSIKFMRKYIHIAKCMKPTLTEDASNVIAEEFARVRSQDAMDSDVARVSNPSKFNSMCSFCAFFDEGILALEFCSFLGLSLAMSDCTCGILKFSGGIQCMCILLNK